MENRLFFHIYAYRFHDMHGLYSVLAKEDIMRLDKFLCEMKIGTRSQVKTFIRQGLVKVNGIVVLNADAKIEESLDQVVFKGQYLQYQKYIYYMLNKPVGVVSATRDDTAPTVVSLLGAEYREDIFPVGRLGSSMQTWR